MNQPVLPLNVEVPTPEEPSRLPRKEFRTAKGPTRFALMDSPIGELTLFGDSESLSGVWTRPKAVPEDWERDQAAFREAIAQLTAYFAGDLREFDLALSPTGTDWQLEVWAALTTIPYGETASYGELAEELGRPTASRAVGMANGRNPISIIVPCHRVIGADGSLTGYAGGLERKRFLLALES
ncbi:methylated-DNA--[protein]-cysteine S-methyltransferase [Nocardiopsis sp. FIRDI 009]|uniref:methylated-DNA--[protein]-cysteine S-methyltransferase n=1 Tax=Nocardiopsis sp. FIRDI 009 TaxID=714197 RepID=UPI000E2282E2|nr:methylated-DNA--[protein]-cysteine S-methyltransferase [Nocardiopsis sp. FIRDI 009]